MARPIIVLVDFGLIFHAFFHAATVGRMSLEGAVEITIAGLTLGLVMFFREPIAHVVLGRPRLKLDYGKSDGDDECTTLWVEVSNSPIKNEVAKAIGVKRRPAFIRTAIRTVAVNDASIATKPESADGGPIEIRPGNPVRFVVVQRRKHTPIVADKAFIGWASNHTSETQYLSEGNHWLYFGVRGADENEDKFRWKPKKFRVRHNTIEWIS